MEKVNMVNEFRCHTPLSEPYRIARPFWICIRQSGIRTAISQSPKFFPFPPKLFSSPHS